MKRVFDYALNIVLVIEVILALAIGYRMVDSIGWDGANYTYHSTNSHQLLTTDYDVHWQKGSVTYKNIPTFGNAVELLIKDRIS